MPAAHKRGTTRLSHGFEGGGCDHSLHGSHQRPGQEGGHAAKAWKRGDSRARPRAEGGPYQRGRGEGKGERGGGSVVFIYLVSCGEALP